MSAVETVKPVGAVVQKSVFKPHETLTGVSFVTSIPFAGEVQSVAIGRNVDSVTPAILAPDGSAIGIKDGQRADGVLLRRKTTNLQTHEAFVDQCFVPWVNVRGLQYGE